MVTQVGLTTKPPCQLMTARMTTTPSISKSKEVNVSSIQDARDLYRLARTWATPRIACMIDTPRIQTYSPSTLQRFYITLLPDG